MTETTTADNSAGSGVAGKMLLARLLMWACCIVLLAPIAALILTAMGDGQGLMAHLFETVLLRYFVNTIMLMLGVGALALVFGVSTAWIVSRYTFPGRRLLDWMLVLPAAVPAYIIAYTYTDFLEYAGPVQTLLRDLAGWHTSREYWFPEIRSMGGAMLVMASVLYPYIYITARTAFRITSCRLYEAAILSGQNIFLKVALPLSRPAIVAGLALVLMEVISDFGTVDYFAVETLTLGIFNVWLGMNSITTSAQIAVMAFVLIIVVLGVELYAQSRNGGESNIKGQRGVPTRNACGIFRILLPLVCGIPVILGFVVPVAVLLSFVVGDLPNIGAAELGNTLFNTVLVALTSSLIIMGLAGFITIMANWRSGAAGRIIAGMAATGYAFPGTILAIGVLTAAGGFDQAITRLSGGGGGILIGSAAMLIFAYIVRFQAVGYGTMRSGIRRLPPNIMPASQVMGHGFASSVRRVALPLLRSSFLAGLLIAFVDIMKELPMTLLLRPFNFETLATVTYQYANEEMLEVAALPALIIVLAGLIPVTIVNRSLDNWPRSRKIVTRG